MKRIGLLGGMSWESSIEYHRIVNEEVRDRLGGLHSCDCLLRSVDFAGIEELQRTGRWDAAAELLVLVGPGDADVPLFDTTRLHATRAVELAIG